MTAALVPGLMRSAEGLLIFGAFSLPTGAEIVVELRPGDLGPIWTSGKGGGLGRRGELDGDIEVVITLFSL